MLNQTISAAINHLLAAESWARDKLRPHAGKSAVIHFAAVDFSCTIEASGLIAPIELPAEPALEVTLTPSALAGALRGEDGALKNAELRGDAELANVVLFLVKNLRWDVEEDAARLVGDIAAHRLASGAGDFVAWEHDARGRLATSVAEYLVQETEVLAAPHAIEAFIADVDRLRDDTARLEKRVARLAAGRKQG